jgi:hypothetical protein
MPFPFVPGGVLLAIAVLTGAITLFGLALRAMDRAFSSGRRTMLPGLVSGIRTWMAPRFPQESTPSSTTVIEPSEADTDTALSARVELVELFNRHIADRD